MPILGVLQRQLVSYIRRGDWKRLRKALDAPSFVDAARSLHERPAFFGASILHLALRHGAPAAVIAGIAERFPETLLLVDAAGRSPLHAGCAVGRSSDVVAAIARAGPSACMRRDRKGRVPLHYACGASGGLRKKPRRLDAGAIFCLVSMAPSSVHVKDIDNANAIEAAILSGADMKLIAFLQDASMAEHLRKQGKLDKEVIAKWGLATLMRWC